VGIAAGMGREMTATLSTGITLFVLSGLYRIELAMGARKNKGMHDAHE
jgi:uncharacterized membrane protein YhiD involved in acid resistance